MKASNFYRVILFLFVFIITINIQSNNISRIFLVGYSLLLFLVGIKNFKLLSLIIISLVPIRSHILIFGSILDFEITFNRVLVLILLITFLFYKTKHPQEKIKSNTIIYLLLLLMIIDLLGVIFGDGHFIPSLKKFISFVFEIFILSYIYYKTFKNQELPYLVFAFSLGCIIMCISAISERVFNFNFLLRFPTSSELYETLQMKQIIRHDVIRIRSSFRNPVYFSGFLPLAFFSAIYLINIVKKIFLGTFLLILCFLSVVLALTRTAIISTLIFIFPTTIFMMSRKIFTKNIIFLFMGIIVGVIILLFIFPLNLTRTSEIIATPTAQRFGGANIAARIALITNGVPFILKQNPFGIGFDEDAIKKSSELTDDMANFFIGYGLRKGILYILFFCFIFLFMIKEMIKHKDVTNILLLFLFLTLIATYLSYGEYWITFPIFLIFFLIYNK